MDDSENGYQASFYQNDDGQIVLAYRVSEGPDNGIDETFKDWIITDAGQAFAGIPKAYEQARDLAEKAKACFQDNLHIIGTSLSGGMANYAAVVH